MKRQFEELPADKVVFIRGAICVIHKQGRNHHTACIYETTGNACYTSGTTAHKAMKECIKQAREYRRNQTLKSHVKATIQRLASHI